jgi:hypothetical protein
MIPYQNPTENKPPKKKTVKALRPSQIINKKRNIYQFEDKWKESFGRPENFAKWFITGPSYSGKSSFLFSLCEYLTNFGKVAYNNYEEGDSETVADKMRMSGLIHKEDLFRLIPKEPALEFKKRLMKRKSAEFGVFDSIQHGQINKELFLNITEDLCVPKKGKSLLFVSHYTKDGLWTFVRHDCDIKVEVINFVANVESRYGGNKPFVIWEEMAKARWGSRYKQVINGQYWPGRRK